MQILITGGTGFIGYHTAMALMGAGHDVRLLVRDEAKMRRMFGDRIRNFVCGDVTDASAIRAALTGCNGVVHTAAMVSIDQKDAELVQRTNVGGTKLVIGGAVDAGVEHIVHVSSVTALYNPEARFLNEYSPPRFRGKRLRQIQGRQRDIRAQSAGCRRTYSHHLPRLGHWTGRSRTDRTPPGPGQLPVGYDSHPPSGNQWVDVRDIARAHLALLETDLYPGRYTLGGHFVTWSKFVDILSKLTGRKMRKIPVPGSFMLGLGRLLDSINKRRDTPLDIPVTYEAMTYATHWVKMDDSKARAELGLQMRPVEETLADTVRWLHSAGHITDEEAGDLAN